MKNYTLFAKLTGAQLVFCALGFILTSNIYYNIITILTAYWVGYYYWEGRHDAVTTKIMQCYTSLRDGVETEWNGYRHDWHDFDMFEKIITLLLTTVTVLVLTSNPLFTLAILVWSGAARYLLHEFFINYFSGVPLSHIAKSGNSFDDFLNKLNLSPKALVLLKVSPVIITYIIVFLTIP